MQTQVLSSSSSPVSFIIRLIPISLFFFFFFLFRRAVDLCSHSSSMVNYDIAPETLIAPPFSLTCFIRLFLSSSHRFPAPRFHSLSTLCTWCLHDPRSNSHFPAFYKLLSNGIFTMIKILLSLSREIFISSIPFMHPSCTCFLRYIRLQDGTSLIFRVHFRSTRFAHPEKG